MKNVKNRNNGNVIGDYDRPRLIKMADVFNDKGDNYLTEIPGCPEKRIKKTLIPISLLNSNENEWGVVVFILTTIRKEHARLPVKSHKQRK